MFLQFKEIFPLLHDFLINIYVYFYYFRLTIFRPVQVESRIQTDLKNVWSLKKLIFKHSRKWVTNTVKFWSAFRCFFQILNLLFSLSLSIFLLCFVFFEFQQQFGDLQLQLQRRKISQLNSNASLNYATIFELPFISRCFLHNFHISRLFLARNRLHSSSKSS